MVNSSSAEILNEPVSVILALFKDAVLDSAPAADDDYGIATLFEKTFEQSTELAKIPSLQQLWRGSHGSASSLQGRLARVQCHVVHSDSEIFGGAYRNRQGNGWQLGRYGLELDETLTGPLREDAIVFEERTTLACCCHAARPDVADALAGLSLSATADEDALRNVTIKLYNEKEEGLLHAHLDVVGLVEVIEADQAGGGTKEVVLHALITRSQRLASALSAQSEETLAADAREQLLTRLGGQLSGDKLAAECLLLALCAGVTVRSPVLLGPLVLNLRNLEQSQAASLVKLLSGLAAYTQPIDLSIVALNKQQLFPSHDGEHFTAGTLQLPTDTLVVLDECGLSEGRLETRGVKNLQSLAGVMTSQELAFAFPFNEFKIAMDLGFVVLSKGKSLLPSALSVPVQQSTSTTSESDGLSTDAASLSTLSTYIARCRLVEVDISDAVSQAIQDDFVRARKAGESIDQERFAQGLQLGKEVARSKLRRQMVFEDYRRGLVIAEEVKARQT